VIFLAADPTLRGDRSARAVRLPEIMNRGDGRHRAAPAAPEQRVPLPARVLVLDD